MLSVTLYDSHSPECFGTFAFLALPRVGESVTVRSATDDFGVRLFLIDEMMHVADEAPLYSMNGTEAHGSGPATMMRATENT